MVNYRRFLTVLFLASVLIAFGAASGAFAQEKIAIDFRQSWIPDEKYLPTIAAIDLGYYAEAGINLSLKDGSGSSTAVKIVGTGKEPLGRADAGAAINGITRGIPIKVIASIYRDSPICLISTTAKITSLDQLVGKKLGDMPTGGNYLAYQAAIKKAGIDPQKINFIALQPGNNTPVLMSGKVDAINGYTNAQVVELRQAGIEPTVLLYRDVGINFYGDSLIANAEFAQKNPQLVKKFLVATAKAFYYVRDNPEKAADMMRKRYPELDKGILLAKQKAEAPLIWTSDLEQTGFGWIDEKRIDELQKVYKEGGVIDTTVDVKMLYTNEFLPKKGELKL